MALWVRSIAAPPRLLQIKLEMLLQDTVEFSNVALGLVPEILDPVDVVSGVCEELGMVD